MTLFTLIISLLSFVCNIVVVAKIFNLGDSIKKFSNRIKQNKTIFTKSDYVVYDKRLTEIYNFCKKMNTEVLESNTSNYYKISPFFEYTFFIDKKDNIHIVETEEKKVKIKMSIKEFLEMIKNENPITGYITTY